MKLETLNSAEQNLLSQISTASGLIEEKHFQLEQNGIYAEYRKLYDAYVNLIDSETEGLEALRRSIFLLWYEQAEPSCFTGLSELSEISSQKVYNFLETRVSANEIDFELKWMLPFYNGIAVWVFEERASLPNLQRFLACADRELWASELKAENFIGRGQMGNYWTSITTSNAVRLDKNAK